MCFLTFEDELENKFDGTRLVNDVSDSTEEQVMTWALSKVF